MSAIMISTITVTDPEAFAAYLEQSKALAGKYGAEMLWAGAHHADLTEGHAPGDRVVIARFPDAERLMAWHGSPEYAELVPLRLRGSEQVMTAYAN